MIGEDSGFTFDDDDDESEEMKEGGSDEESKETVEVGDEKPIANPYI